MALREIRKIGDDILRKKSRIVDKVDDRIKVIIEDMVETMRHADGVGLAAPQVGILKRIIVVDIGDERGLIKLINPEIIESEGIQINSEGCLSVPDVNGDVKRPFRIKVSGLNEKGEEVMYEGIELFAKAISHEIDHLDGILFVDKIEKEM
jgi:peptide deformylase